MVTAIQYSLFDLFDSQRAFEPCLPSSDGLKMVTSCFGTIDSNFTNSGFSDLEDNARTGTEILEILLWIKLLGSKYSPGEKTINAPTFNFSGAVIKLSDAE